jgi:hypothetical protein
MEGEHHMQPYHYMQKVSSELPTMTDPVNINNTLDELEFLYQCIDPEFQELCSDLIAQLTSKLRPVY